MIGRTSNPNELVSLYFHIPFCKRKCDYCHFYVLPDKEALKIQLLEGLKLEWNYWLPFLKNKTIHTIYFGGGTPSLFGPERIASILDLIAKTATVQSDAEITLEVNPENVNISLMTAYAKAGINRVSLGIQTLDSKLLHMLGRMHQPQTALDAVHVVYQAGIKNISIDLMYDLPNQTLEDWNYTLKQIHRLPLTHLSLYNLTIEPHTVFFKRQNELIPSLPNEQTSLDMYESAVDFLNAIDLKQYEISAFAKEGFESKHNSGYWTGRSFLGLGPSAFSYWDNKRFRNRAHLGKYLRALNQHTSPVDFEELLDPGAHVRELFVIGLRLISGVHLPSFQADHGNLDTLTLKTMNKFIEEGYLKNQNHSVRLTKKGILFYDTVASELI